MADDLRERIRRGELAALADPALPLHLLAEPGADWWREGRRQALLRLWGLLLELRGLSDVGVLQTGGQVPTVRAVRRLRAPLPAVPAEVDAALAVLECYAL